MAGEAWVCDILLSGTVCLSAPGLELSGRASPPPPHPKARTILPFCGLIRPLPTCDGILALL